MPVWVILPILAHCLHQNSAPEWAPAYNSKRAPAYNSKNQ